MPSSRLIQLVFLCLLILVGCAAPENVLTQTTQSQGGHTAGDRTVGGHSAGRNTGGIGGTGVILQNERSGSSGIGGTGQVADRGIGGTGQIADRGIGGTGQKLESGIGGTGQHAHLDTNSSGEGSGSGSGGIGGTGIVGTITGFGSIWVNNTRVTFDSNTPITINKQPATAGDFELGQVVAVTSQRYQNEPVDTERWHSPQEVFFGDSPPDQPNNTFKAKSIDVVYEVVGPVNQVLSAEHKLSVLNQNVFVTERTAILDRRTGKPVSLAELDVSDYVQVSGLRQSDGDIIASRLDVVNAMTQVELIGPLSQSDQGHWQIHDQSLVIDPALLGIGSEDYLGNRVLITGVMSENQFIVEQIEQDSIELIFTRVHELIYEGFIFDEGLDGVINIGGQAFNLPEVVDFTEGDWNDTPIQINAQQLEEGEYEAYDLWIDEGDDYRDLLPEDDWTPYDVYDESIDYEDDYIDIDEAYFDEDIGDEYFDEGVYDDEFFYEEEYYEEYYYEEEVEYDEVYEE